MTTPFENSPTIVKEGQEIGQGLIVGVAEEIGLTTVYRVDTGAAVQVMDSMVEDNLNKKKDENGNPVFTRTKPPYEPQEGALTCPLHEDHDDRAQYTEMGLPFCTKRGLHSPYEQENHMRRRHPTAHSIIQANEERQRSSLDDEFKRSMISRSAGVQTVEQVPHQEVCKWCGEVSEHTNERVAKMNMARHAKQFHPEKEDE
tara:strand:+ start:142 stop:744 length:603 start_codon:yes stop_codon:yes gene_type:complete